MLISIPQAQSSTVDLSLLQWSLEGTILGIEGLARTPQGWVTADRTFDLAGQEPGPIFLGPSGATFDPEGALAHLGQWDGADVHFIEHTGG